MNRPQYLTALIRKMETTSWVLPLSPGVMRADGERKWRSAKTLVTKGKLMQREVSTAHTHRLWSQIGLDSIYSYST